MTEAIKKETDSATVSFRKKKAMVPRLVRALSLVDARK